MVENAKDISSATPKRAVIKTVAKTIAGTLLLLMLSVFSLWYGTNLMAGGHRYCMRAAQSEAKSSLKSIYYAQQAYHGIHGEYGRTFDEIGYKGVGRKYPRYMIYMGNDVMEASHSIGNVTFPGWLRLTESSKSEFIAYAIANPDTDNTLDVWMINSHKELVNLVDDIDN